MAVLDRGGWFPDKETHELSGNDSFCPPEKAEEDR